MIIIGDIAGHFKSLEALVAKLPANKELLSLGDMVDRGPDSRKVVDFFKNHKALLGNHEHMLLDAYDFSVKLKDLSATCDNWRSIASSNNLKAYYVLGLWLENNGGDATVESYCPGLIKKNYGKILNLDEVIFKISEIIPLDHVLWMKSLPKFIIDDKFFYSHAPKHVRLDLSSANDLGKGFWDLAGCKKSDMSLIWNRKDPGPMNYIQVFGHNSYSAARGYSASFPNGIGLDKILKKNLSLTDFYAWGIDTSAARVLTALDTDTMTFYHQPYID